MPHNEFVSTDPMTGAIVWKGVPGNVDAAVVKARKAFPRWAQTSLAERIAHTRRFQEIVLERKAAFAEAIPRETGKPLWEAQTEVAGTAAKVTISIEAQETRAGVRQGELAGARQFVRHKPHGVLAVLGPYNFPAHLPNGHFVPALLAGNTIVFKPSELTPHVAEFMVSCWNEANLPDGVLNIVQGQGETGRILAAHGDIDGLLFTGSHTTGLKLHQQFAGQPDKILALEMGGNNPLIAWDLDQSVIEAAATLIVQSAYISAGQRCTCARRLIVQEEGYERIIDAVTALTDKLIVGGPFDQPEPFMGPVISNQAADGLQRSYEQLIGNGGQIIRPLHRADPELPLLSPALVDVTDVQIDDEEHFGPLLQVCRVGSFDEAIQTANNTRFGLAAGLIGGNEDLYKRFWAESRAGVVNWNRPTTGASSNAPFGGIGLSGNHRPSAYYAADYSAWPVASLEAEYPEGKIATGVRQSSRTGGQ